MLYMWSIRGTSEHAATNAGYQIGQHIFTTAHGFINEKELVLVNGVDPMNQYVVDVDKSTATLGDYGHRSS